MKMMSADCLYECCLLRLRKRCKRSYIFRHAGERLYALARRSTKATQGGRHNFDTRLAQALLHFGYFGRDDDDPTPTSAAQTGVETRGKGMQTSPLHRRKGHQYRSFSRQWKGPFEQAAYSVEDR